MPSYTWSFAETATPLQELTEAEAAAAVVGRDLKLDENGDLAMEGGDFVLTTLLDAVRQDVDLTLSLHEGEAFEDLEEGVPYRRLILVKPFRGELIRSLIRTKVLSCAGVKSILEMTLTAPGRERHSTLTFRADTDLGELVATGEEA